MTHLVAVYGTLRAGQGNSHLLDNAIARSLETVDGWGMVSLGGFPAVAPDPHRSILTEVYEVTDTELKSLDCLEGFCSPGSENNFYDRTVIETTEGPAFMYYIPGILEEDYDTIEDGNWVEYRLS